MCGRENHGETRAPRLRFDFDGPIVLGNDVLADSETETKAEFDAALSRAEAKIEDPCEMRRGDTGSGIDDLNTNVGWIWSVRADDQRAGSVERLECIDNEIRPHLVQLPWVALDERKRAVVALNVHSEGAMPDQHQRVFEPFVQIDVRVQFLSRPRVRPEAADEIGNPTGRRSDVAQCEPEVVEPFDLIEMCAQFVSVERTEPL